MSKSLRYGLGLLDYTDDSPHIIRRLPLTSNDTDGIGGATVVGAEAGTFDSVLGYKPYYTDGISAPPANGHLLWDAASAPLVPANLTHRILGGYTISFEAETAQLLNLITVADIVEIQPVTASSRIRPRIAATSISVNVNQGSRVPLDTTGINLLAYADRKSDDDFASTEYTRIYMSCSTGGKWDIFFGNKWMFSGQFTSGLTSDTNPLNKVYLGGTAFGETFSGYMRNLMVIDKPVSFKWDTNIGRISMIGDSITEQGNTIASDNYPFSSAARFGANVGLSAFADYALPTEIHRRLSESDRYVQPYSFAVSGSRVSLGGSEILDQVDGTNAANARLHRPYIMTIGGGANDVINSIDMTEGGGAGSFVEGYRTILDEILSWGFVKGIVFANIMPVDNNPTYDTPTFAAAVVTGNNTIEALKDEYSNLYRNVRFSIADRYTAFGGATTNSDLFLANDIHPSAKGQYVQGETLAQGVIDLGL